MWKQVSKIFRIAFIIYALYFVVLALGGDNIWYLIKRSTQPACSATPTEEYFKRPVEGEESLKVGDYIVVLEQGTETVGWEYQVRLQRSLGTWGISYWEVHFAYEGSDNDWRHIVGPDPFFVLSGETIEYLPGYSEHDYERVLVDCPDSLKVWDRDDWLALNPPEPVRPTPTPFAVFGEE